MGIDEINKSEVTLLEKLEECNNQQLTELKKMKSSLGTIEVVLVVFIILYLARLFINLVFS